MQLTVSIFLIALVFCSSHCGNFEGSPPPLPKQGVRFYSGLINQSIPNYGMISQSVFRQGDYGLGYQRNNDIGENDGLNDGLWCQSPIKKNNVGKWKSPNGTILPSSSNYAFSVYQVYALGQVGLLRPQNLGKNPSDHLEGVYECEIPDENEVSQTLVLWIAEDGTYERIKAFNTSEVKFHLPPQRRDADPPRFMLQFTVNEAPPTNVTCYVGSQKVDMIDLYRQPLSTVYTSTGPPVTFSANVTLAPNPRIGGDYWCTVSVYRNNGTEGGYPLADVQTSSVYISVPDAPTNLVATRSGYDSVKLTWTLSTMPVTGYEVFYAVLGSETSSSWGTTHNNFATVTGLSLDTEYEFYVVAYRNASNSLPSERSDSVTFEMTIPALIGPLNATSTHDTITVFWNEPDTLPSDYILSAVCELPCGEGQMIPTVPDLDPDDTSANITGLHPGSRCVITLKVCYGQEPCGAVSVRKKTTFNQVPSSPPRDLLVVDFNDTTKDLCWSPVPCIEANGIITDYKIKYGPSGGGMSMVKIPANQGEKYTLIGLSACTQYTLSIAAVNKAGTSAFSPEETCCTECSNLVSPPGNLKCKRKGFDSVILSWDPPALASLPVKEYVVFYRELPNGMEQSRKTNETTIVIDGLKISSTYEFYVVAHFQEPNDGNPCNPDLVPSPPSDPKTEIIDPPVLPEPLTATCTDESITVSWTQPDIDPTEYELQVRCKYLCDGSELIPTFTSDPHWTENSAIISDLAPATECEIYLTALYKRVGSNTIRSNTISTTKTINPTQGPSSAPNLSIVSRTSTNFRVCWTELPCKESNGIITSYVIKYSNTSGNYYEEIPANGLKHTLDNLAICMEYTVSIAAKNDVGRGPFSSAITDCTGCAGLAADVPQELGAHRNGYKTVYLYWTAPNRNIPKVTHYEVFYEVQGTGNRQSWDFSNHTNIVVDSGLKLQNVYEFCVVAHSSKPGANPSSCSNTTEVNLTCPQFSSSLQATSTPYYSIEVSWTAPEFDPDLYILEAKCQGFCDYVPYYRTLYPDSDAESITIYGVDPGTTCNISLTAQYDLINCSKIETTEDTPITDPPQSAPKNLMVVEPPKPTSLSLTWSQVPCRESNGPITSYLIKYGNCTYERTIPIPASDGEQYILKGLHGCSEYELSIAAVNAIGNSTFSAPIMGQTECTTDHETGVDFQLKFGRVSDCSTWTLKEADILEKDLKKAIIATIKENCGCDAAGHSCKFDKYSIVDGTFSCYGSCAEVTYRATMVGRIDSAPNHPTSYLSHLEYWAKSGNATFISELRRMWINTECSIVVDQFSDSECKPNQVPSCCDKCGCPEAKPKG